MKSIYLDTNNILCINETKAINPFTDPSEVGFYLSDCAPGFSLATFIDYAGFGSAVEKNLLTEIEMINNLLFTPQLRDIKTNIQGQSLYSLQKKLEKINSELENSAINGNHLAIVADRYSDFTIGSYINASATPHVAWLFILVEIYKDFLFTQQQIIETQTVIKQKEKKLTSQSEELQDCKDEEYVALKIEPIKSKIAQLKRDEKDLKEVLKNNPQLNLFSDNGNIDTKNTVFEDIFATCGFPNKRAVSMLESFKTIVFT